MNNIDLTIAEQMCKMDEMLSRDYVFYFAEVDGEKFNLLPPFSAEDLIEFEQLKKRYITLMFQKALNKLVQEVIDNNYLPLEEPKAFNDVDEFLAMDVPRDAFVSEFSAEYLQGLKDEAAAAKIKAKPLDLDNVHINMQRPGWTAEDQEKFLANKDAKEERDDN